MTNQPITVLLLEDDAGFAELLEQILPRAVHSPVIFRRVPRLSDAVDALKSPRFDIILLDLNVPDSSGKATFTKLLAHAGGTPVVVLTSVDDEALAIETVREGAQDYIVKAQLDAMLLGRIVRYAIERKRAEERLREREEFFRLISENVSDLIAVVDDQGRRLYNSPSYRDLLGDPERLKGTDSFQEIHPEDRPRVERLFRDTIATGMGLRAEYRMVGRNGAVRHIESHGSVIRDLHGGAPRVVVVSRDITERKETVEVLREALSDVSKAHEELKAAQLQLVQSEKLEAVSTFAAGVAHEVKNPLQTIILGVDYLSRKFGSDDKTSGAVLKDMADAVHRADGIIRGLMEFSAHGKRTVKEEDLSGIVEQALQAIRVELANLPIVLKSDLPPGLPALRVDLRTMKHVFINLLMYCVRAMAGGGTLAVRTYAERLGEPLELGGRKLPHFKPGETVVFAVVEDTADHAGAASGEAKAGRGAGKDVSGLGLTVLKKIIELYGGVIHVDERREGSQYTMVFKAPKI